MEILRKQLGQLTLNVELEDITTLQAPHDVSVMQAMPACTVDIYNNEVSTVLKTFYKFDYSNSRNILIGIFPLQNKNK